MDVILWSVVEFYTLQMKHLIFKHEIVDISIILRGEMKILNWKFKKLLRQHHVL